MKRIEDSGASPNLIKGKLKETSLYLAPSYIHPRLLKYATCTSDTTNIAARNIGYP